MTYIPFIFPTIQNKIWKEVELDAYASRDFSMADKNPLLDAEFCDNWVLGIAQSVGADYTWGGHFEDRKHLWTGYYSEFSHVTHLGVDYNVPSGTPVAAPRHCTVVHSWADTSTKNGWGGRLVLRLDEPWEGAPYLVLGHLAHLDLPPVGARFEKGETITITGKPHENGGWFPHLHVQCVSEDYYQAHADNLELLDGYYLEDGKPYNLAPSPQYLVGKIKP